MNPGDYIVIGLVALILGTAIGYIRREKKAGKKCIGCPCSGNCSGNCGSCGLK